MQKKIFIISISLFLILNADRVFACSVIYYINQVSGKIYTANNEDYWYDGKITKLNLRDEFQNNKKRKIMLE